MNSVIPSTVSIVLASYNGGRFIRAQLESLGAQTLQPLELIVNDDGSTDDTVAVATAFERRAPFPVTIRSNPTRLGYADNFLDGCERAAGDLIAFCDQDDVWMPTKLARCAAVFAGDPAVVLAVHAATVVDAGLNARGFCKPDFARTTTLAPQGCELEFSQPGFAMVFAARLLRLAGRPDRARDALKADRPLMAHDQWVRFAARSVGRVVQLADRLAWYRQHDGNTCGAAEGGPPMPTLNRAANEAAYRQRADASEYYSRFLAAQPDVPASWRARVQRSSTDYHHQAETYAARTRLYAAGSSVGARFTSFGSLVTSGAYRSRRASGLGWRAGIKDAGALLLGESNPLLLFR